MPWLREKFEPLRISGGLGAKNLHNVGCFYNNIPRGNSQQVYKFASCRKKVLIKFLRSPLLFKA